MTFIMSDDEVLSVAIAGVPKVAEFIAGVPMEHVVVLLTLPNKATSKPHTLWATKTLRPNNGFRQ